MLVHCSCLLAHTTMGGKDLWGECAMFNFTDVLFVGSLFL